MKFLALYWALGFEETKLNIFIKRYKRYEIKIYSEKQYVDFGNEITIVGGKHLPLFDDRSFVILECINRLLEIGYKPSEIIIDLNNEYQIYVVDLYIKCFAWGNMDLVDEAKMKKNTFLSIRYSSRLTSGAIERISKIKTSTGDIYDYGIFETPRKKKHFLYNKIDVACSDADLIIKGDKLVRYIGNKELVKIPNGIKEIGSCAFWDNQSIRKIVLPDTIINLGGDTFYNCRNLEEVTIPKFVSSMGNNPFAGCPKLNLCNKSKNFVYKDGALYTKNYSRLIYYRIKNKNAFYAVNKKTKVIGKHSFFLCDNLKKLVIPSSIVKLENNPFSGCSKLSLENHSCHYHIVDKVIYNRYKTEVIGCLNSINTKCLNLLPVKNINRNSFWNCAGIQKIVLPSSLVQIGYNPFVGCSNIHFVNKSNAYEVVDDVLYSKDKKKIICYPAWKAVGVVKVNPSVTQLERGAFSGCKNMKEIKLNNVEVILKTCFTNCESLKLIRLSPKIKYVGEWAFAYCSNMKEALIHKNVEVEYNAFINNPAIIKRF